MSVRGQILTNFAARLATITTANGFSTNVKTVYSDEIPMGINLLEHQLPAIFVIPVNDPLVTEHRVLKGEWQFDLQLWHNKVSDSIMNDFVRDVFKAIYANSPTAEREDEFRTIHSQITEVKPLLISSDLNMIETNRIHEVSFVLSYRTKLFNM